MKGTKKLNVPVAQREEEAGAAIGEYLTGDLGRDFLSYCLIRYSE